MAVSASGGELAAKDRRRDRVAHDLATGLDAAGAQGGDQIGQAVLLGQADADHRHAQAREDLVEVAELGDQVGPQVAGGGGGVADAHALVGGHDELGLAGVTQVQGRLAHPGGGRDGLHRHAGVTDLAHQGDGGLEDRIVVLGRSGAAAGGGARDGGHAAIPRQAAPFHAGDLY